MILPNGDGTWTVRFYKGSGVADYVTVNNELPVVSQALSQAWAGTVGGLAYNGCWTITSPTGSNGLWLALVEKAYAQWNEVGSEGHGSGLDGENAYATIAGGFSQPVMDQVLGAKDNSKDLMVGAANDQTVIQDVNTKGDVVTGGTISGLNSMYTPDNLIVEGHEYAIIAASGASVTVFNPWGSAPDDNMNVPPVKTQPPPLVWADFNADFSDFAVATTLNSQPFLPPSTAGATTAAGATTGTATTSSKVKLPPVFGLAAGTAAGNLSAAAGAWFALAGSQASSQKDLPQPATNDLALLAYLD
jgi:hypothetical protein